MAPALSGLDLGLVFTTWFTFSGVWFLVCLAFVSSSITAGAGLFVCYWLGRALSVWLAPLMMSDARVTPQLLGATDARFRMFQLIHVLGVCIGLAILNLYLVQIVEQGQ